MIPVCSQGWEPPTGVGRVEGVALWYKPIFWLQSQCLSDWASALTSPPSTPCRKPPAQWLKPRSHSGLASSMKWQSTLPSNVFGISTLLIADRPAFCWRTRRVVRDPHLCWAQGMDVTLVLSSLIRMFTGAGQVLQPTGNIWACVCVCVYVHTCVQAWGVQGERHRETEQAGRTVFWA